MPEQPLQNPSMQHEQFILFSFVNFVLQLLQFLSSLGLSSGGLFLLLSIVPMLLISGRFGVLVIGSLCFHVKFNFPLFEYAIVCG